MNTVSAAIALVAKTERIEARKFLADPAPPTTGWGDIIERATVYPYVVRVYCQKADGTKELFGGVVAGRCAPDVHDFIPEGSVHLWSEVYRATRFDDMGEAERERKSADYRAYLMFRKARALDVPVESLKAWVDFDPILMDGAIARWIKEGGAS